MSQLRAKIEHIESVDNLNIVTFLCEGQTLQMLSLELDESIQAGRSVTLACKPTAVALAKPSAEREDFSSVLSYANQLHVTIDAIDEGKLLCSILLSLGAFTLESILSRDAAARLKLSEGDAVIALIKANELSILEVHDD